MKLLSVFGLYFLVIVLSMPAYTDQSRTLLSHSADSMEGVKSLSGVSVDRNNSYQGEGSLKVVADSSRTVRLLETGDVEVEDARLFYSARLRSRDLSGSAYLEMWARIPGKGRFFSRGLDQTLTGTTDWTEVQIPFLLKSGQNPDKVQLNLVIKGKGTVWIDDIKLTSSPL